MTMGKTILKTFKRTFLINRFHIGKQFTVGAYICLVQLTRQEIKEVLEGGAQEGIAVKPKLKGYHKNIQIFDWVGVNSFFPRQGPKVQKTQLCVSPVETHEIEISAMKFKYNLIFTI